jgi:hypothetical protein
VGFAVLPHIRATALDDSEPQLRLTITGTAFGDAQGTSYVNLGDRKVTDFLAWSDREIRLVVPGDVESDVDVTVVTAAGRSNSMPMRATYLYFAEGYTGPGFRTFVTLANPGNEIIEVQLDYMFVDGGWEVQMLAIPPGHRATVDVNAVVGPDRELSIRVVSGDPFIAERPMYFNYRGAWEGGHCTQGTASPAKQWYFAEGYTGPGFDQYLCVLNPGDRQALLTFNFQTQEAGRITRNGLVVPPYSRATFKVNDLLGSGYQNSLELLSSEPVVAERSMYFEYTPRSEAPAAAGPSAAAAGEEEAREDGEPPRDGSEEAEAVDPERKGEPEAVDPERNDEPASVDPEREDEPAAAGEPGTFQRAEEASRAWRGGHCVMGKTALAWEYYFAEGTTRDGFDAWLTLQNPGESDIQVRAYYHLGEGQGTVPEKVYNVPAGRRVTLFLPDEVGRDKDVSIHLVSDSPFLAERPTYFDYHHQGLEAQGGHCVAGISSPAREWYFAEGYTGPGFDQWLCIQNPGNGQAEVEITYWTQEAGALPARRITVPAETRKTILVDTDAGAGHQLSTRVRVISGDGVVVESPMYFIFNGTWDGGHAVEGAV